MVKSKFKFDWLNFDFEALMELKEMQAAFNAGGLVSATVFNAPLMGGYILSVKTKNGSSHPMTSQRDTDGHPRGFKTIDAAVANARKIGFAKITVELDWFMARYVPKVKTTGSYQVKIHVANRIYLDVTVSMLQICRKYNLNH